MPFGSHRQADRIPTQAGGRPKVLVTRPIQQPVIDKIAEACDMAVHPVDETMPQELLIAAVQDIDALLVSGVQITKEIVEAAPKLRVISATAVGYDHIDIRACTQRRVLVTNTPDVLTEATADIAFVLLVATARRVVESDRYLREGRWKQPQWEYLWGVDIHGKTLGLYGFGRIAQATARRARGFGMQVLYYARHRAPESIEHELSAEFVEFETLLRRSDFLSLHVPLTPETRHSIAAQQLALMKPTAFLINTARGPIVDEEALVHALQGGRLAGAGLDVFEHEPTVHPALIGMENVTLLPHIGSGTVETRFRMAALAAENLLAALRGERPPNLVNPEVLA